MDILEKKGPNEFDDDLKDIINLIKFKNNKIELKGSSNLKSQQYFSDYDLFSQIRTRSTVLDIYDEIKGILKAILDTHNLYFIELKIQSKNGDKYRWFYKDEFNFNDFEKHFKDVDFLKLDMVASSTQNKFTEVSCIYSFSNNEFTNQEYIKKVEGDIKDLKKEGKYYKILKRLFLIAKVKNDKNMMLMLSQIFNSELGAEYQKLSNLEAIELLLKYYDDAKTRKRVELNLNDLNLPQISHLKRNIKELNIKLNKEAKKIYISI